MVLRLSYWRVLRRPGASRPSLASVGSTGARTGRSGASKLANAASRIRGRLFGADVCHWPRLCGAQSGGPGMSALTPLLGLSRRERRSLCFHYTRDGASIIRTRPSRAPLIWTRVHSGVCGAESFDGSGVLPHRDGEHHRQCSSKLTTFDRTLVVKLQLAAFCYYKAAGCSVW